MNFPPLAIRLASLSRSILPFTGSIRQPQYRIYNFLVRSLDSLYCFCSCSSSSSSISPASPHLHQDREKYSAQTRKIPDKRSLHRHSCDQQQQQSTIISPRNNYQPYSDFIEQSSPDNIYSVNNLSAINYSNDLFSPQSPSIHSSVEIHNTQYVAMHPTVKIGAFSVIASPNIISPLFLEYSSAPSSLSSSSSSSPPPPLSPSTSNLISLCSCSSFSSSSPSSKSPPSSSFPNQYSLASTPCSSSFSSPCLSLLTSYSAFHKHVSIGRFVEVAPNVTLYDNVQIQNYSIIYSNTCILSNTRLYPKVLIGITPQDKKYDIHAGEEAMTATYIGENCDIRDGVRIERGTRAAATASEPMPQSHSTSSKTQTIQYQTHPHPPQSFSLSHGSSPSSSSSSSSSSSNQQHPLSHSHNPYSLAFSLHNSTTSNPSASFAQNSFLHITHHYFPQVVAATIIRNNVLLMADVYIGHDVYIDDGCVIANRVSIAGHAVLHKNVTIGGHSAIHQKCVIGTAAMVGGMSAIRKDVIPYTMVSGNPARLVGLNQKRFWHLLDFVQRRLSLAFFDLLFKNDPSKLLHLWQSKNYLGVASEVASTTLLTSLSTLHDRALWLHDAQHIMQIYRDIQSGRHHSTRDQVSSQSGADASSMFFHVWAEITKFILDNPSRKMYT